MHHSISVHKNQTQTKKNTLFKPTETTLRSKGVLYPRWRCFIKGISVTHVMVTLLPAAESDVQLINQPNEVEVDRHVLRTPDLSQPLQDESTTEHIEYKQLYGGGGETSQSGDISPVQRDRAETAVRLIKFSSKCNVFYYNIYLND